MPKWMFETRTDQWHEAGLGEQIVDRPQGRTWPRLILFALLIAGVLVAFNHRADFAADYPTESRILTAILLFAFGWGFAAALGRALTPFIMRRLDPGTAGTVGFAIRLITILLVGLVALGIAGVKPQTLAVGGAFTAIVLGLAAQQTLGNVFAGIVLQSTRPFRVGERVRLTGGPLAGSVEGTVSSLGLFYISILKGQDRMMIPNSILLNLAVEPLREPDSIDLRARFDSHLSPATVQDMLRQAITVPTLRPPRIEIEEVDRDEVLLRISATPTNPGDGAKLAEQVVSVTRGTFEYEKPDLSGRRESESDQKPDPDVPHGHS
ncbi:MAG: mechanosensitive ion channel family protein [Solirubrobacterales bacterium]|nr:mechanosensitive ion channel family protein [Solirubrobacterales bacterium]